MLPGLTPALFGGALAVGPPLGVDANTVSLMKFDGVYNMALSANFNALVDYAKPSRVWSGTSPATSPVRYGGTGVDCDGSRILSPVNDPDYAFAGDFTIDFWVAAEGVAAGNNGAILNKSGANAYSPWYFYQDSSFGLTFYASSNGTSWDIASNKLVGGMGTGVWHHYAVQRKGNVWNTWYDGTKQQEWTTALVPMANTEAACIGNHSNPTSVSPWGGYIDEVRFSNVARYNANFTVQRFPYFPPLNGSNDAATRLLLHAEDYIDNALGQAHRQPHNLITQGTVALSTAQAKFGSKSLRFDGSTACGILLPNITHWDMEPTDCDFTVDFWYYRVSAATSGNVFGTRSSNSNFASWFIYDDAANGRFLLYGSVSNTAWDAFNNVALCANGAIPTGQWVHCALVHSNDLPDASAVRFYVNGVQTATINFTKGTRLILLNQFASIGGLSDQTSPTAHMDEIRYSSVARWVANFTPPAAPYLDPPAITNGNDRYTRMLLHLDAPIGSAATSVYPDAALAATPKTWTGGALISAAQSKFGGASALFNGANAFSTPDHNDFRLGSMDFTIDCWFMLTGGAGTRRFIWGHCDSSAAATAISTICEVNNANQLYCNAIVGSTGYVVTATTVPALNTWYHLAFVRTGNILKLFLNGVQEGGNVAISGLVNPGSGIYAIGALGAYPSGLNFFGHIEEYRLSVGIARWTSNFTPPIAAYSPVPPVATHFSVTAPATATTSAPVNVTVQALDALNNPTSNYSGTVHFTSTDGAAILPANSTLTGGFGTFPVSFKTAGVRTVTATDTVTGTINGTSGNVTVSKVRQFIAFTTAGAGTWTVPADWNNADNAIEVIGAGGGGGNSAPGSGTSSGGGGAYSKLSNVALTPGAVKNYSVGAGGLSNGGTGGNTWLRIDTGNTSPSNTSQGLVAIGGGGGEGSLRQPTPPAPGGDAALGIGTVKYSGGYGAGGDITFYSSGGGGGAAGPFGDGGAAGDAQGYGAGGQGGYGDAGHGGAGGGTSAAQPGGNGTEWTITAGGSVGAGGGPSGSNGGGASGAPGLYGAGGWGGGNGGAGTAGARGLIVISYLPI